MKLEEHGNSMGRGAIKISNTWRPKIRVRCAGRRMGKRRIMLCRTHGIEGLMTDKPGEEAAS